MTRLVDPIASTNRPQLRHFRYLVKRTWKCQPSHPGQQRTAIGSQQKKTATMHGVSFSSSNEITASTDVVNYSVPTPSSFFAATESVKVPIEQSKPQSDMHTDMWLRVTFRVFHQKRPGSNTSEIIFNNSAAFFIQKTCIINGDTKWLRQRSVVVG